MQSLARRSQGTIRPQNPHELEGSEIENLDAVVVAVSDKQASAMMRHKESAGCGEPRQLRARAANARDRP